MGIGVVLGWETVSQTHLQKLNFITLPIGRVIPSNIRKKNEQKKDPSNKCKCDWAKNENNVQRFRPLQWKHIGAHGMPWILNFRLFFFLRPLYFIEYAFPFHFHIYDYIWKHWSVKYNSIVDQTRSMCFYSMPWLHFQIRLCATLFGRQQYIIIIIKYITLCIISVADIIVYFKLSTDIVLVLSLERCWRRSWVAKL